MKGWFRTQEITKVSILAYDNLFLFNIKWDGIKNLLQPEEEQSHQLMKTQN
jgi:hypothetical protein